jgi:hypothetical protein
MQATAVFAVAVVVGLLMLVVFGLAWFLAVPIAILLFLVPVAFGSAFGLRRAERTAPTGSAAMPSSQEAAYEPIVDPAQRRHGSR